MVLESVWKSRKNSTMKATQAEKKVLFHNATSTSVVVVVVVALLQD